MERNLNFDEISDGKKYTKDDLCKIGCDGCCGKASCCKFAEDTILLDPYDIYSLSVEFKKDFKEMLDSEISLKVVDYVITPYLLSSNGACVFLNNEGRCNIHANRPGFCRLFPLGRIWNEDGSFNYFMQVNECPNKNTPKTKIKAWLNIARLKDYEAFVSSWHMLLSRIKEIGKSNDPEKLQAVNMLMLNTFFVDRFDSGSDFYLQFNERFENILKSL